MNKIEIIKKQFNDNTSDFEFKINRLIEKLKLLKSITMLK